MYLSAFFVVHFTFIEIANVAVLHSTSIHFLSFFPTTTTIISNYECLITFTKVSILFLFVFQADTFLCDNLNCSFLFLFSMKMTILEVTSSRAIIKIMQVFSCMHNMYLFTLSCTVHFTLSSSLAHSVHESLHNYL